MTKEAEKYLESLDLTKAVRQAIDQHREDASRVCPEIFEDVFVSSYQTAEGRQWTSLHLFGATIAVECTNFLTSNQFDIVPYFGRITFIEFHPTDFDLRTADKGRLVVKAYLKSQYVFELSGTDGNAAALIALATRRLVPALQILPQTT